MRHSFARIFGRLGGLGDERGQSLTLFALGLVGMLVMAGLAIDIGNLMQRRTSLQRSVDAAALAGAQELASLTPDTAGAKASAVGYMTTNEASIGGSAAPTIKFGSTNRANDTIKVEAKASVDFLLLKLAGIESGAADADATVLVGAANGFRIDENDVFPYAVWGGARTAAYTNSCPFNICLGSTQVYRSNHYEDDSHVAGSGWDVNGNNFKGYFHHGGDIVYINPNEWQTFSKGGNATGQQPLDELDEHYESGKPIVVPVISAASCQGGCGDIKFKIVAWVALELLERPNPSRAWTGKVVEWSSPEGYMDGPHDPPQTFANVWTGGLRD